MSLSTIGAEIERGGGALTAPPLPPRSDKVHIGDRSLRVRRNSIIG